MFRFPNFRSHNLRRHIWAFLILIFLITSPVAATGCRDDDKYEGCCKVCDVGKACGDSCINKQLTCNKEKGCACNK